MAKKKSVNIKKINQKQILEVKRIAKDASAPEYMINTDVGLDLKANENVILKPMEQKLVRTGIVIKIPDNHVGLIRDRAGIVTKMNVHTAAGTFDPAYRGEISIVLVNFGDEEVMIEKGMRIAQIIILPVTKVVVKEVKSLSETERGEKSFGSTGLHERLEEMKKLVKQSK
jgi:dUTP pyrophosphatase